MVKSTMGISAYKGVAEEKLYAEHFIDPLCMGHAVPYREVGLGAPWLGGVKIVHKWDHLRSKFNLVYAC